MRIGFQTICFGDKLRKEDWGSFIPALREAGYEGVEIFQHPDNLPSYRELLRLGERHAVEILGFTGGTLGRRIEYLEEDRASLEKSRPYLYIEDRTEKDKQGNFVVDLAIANGHRLALHYHHLCQLQSFEEAVDLLLNHPEMEWLPDTAHLFMALRGNVKGALKSCGSPNGDEFGFGSRLVLRLEQQITEIAVSTAPA